MSGDDVVQRVVLDIETKGDLSKGIADAKGQAADLDKAFKSMTGTIGSVADHVRETFVGAFETVATAAVGVLAAGVGLAVHQITDGVFGLNTELEKTKFSLATLFNNNGAVSSVPQGLSMASGMMDKMRKDAAALPGEFADLVNIFKMSLNPGLAAGATPERLQKLAANVMAGGAASGLDMGMVAREFGQLLGGRANAHNILGAQMFGLAGDKAREFNRKSGAQRLDFLEKGFAKSGEAIPFFAATMDAISSTMKDNFKRIKSEATTPLFESVKRTMAEMIGFYDTHSEQILSTAKHVGGWLAYYFDQGVNSIKRWTPAILEFGRELKKSFEDAFRVAEPYIHKLTAMLSHVTPKGIIEGGKMAIGAYGVAKVGLPMAESVVGSLGGIIGPLVSAISASAGGGSAGLAAVGEAAAVGGVGAAAGAAATAAVLVSIAGAWSAINDEASAFHNIATLLWSNIKSHVNPTVDHLSATFDRLKPVLIGLAEAMGVGMLLILDQTLSIVDMVTGAFNALHSGLTSLYDYVMKIARYLTDTFGITAEKQESDAKPQGSSPVIEWMKYYNRELEDKINPKVHDSVMDPIDRSQDIADLLTSAYKRTDIQGDKVIEAKKREDAHKGRGSTNIQKVEIVVTSNSDPSRIARLVFSELSSIAKNRTSSSGARNFSGSRGI